MKKLLTIAVLGGLFAASTLHAQVTIYMCGSTAFRANVIRAVTNLYGANITSQNDGNAGDAYPADVSGKGAVTFAGTIPSLFGGNTVTIKCFWTGSVQGIHTLLFNDTLNYFNSATSGVTNLDQHPGADIAFSDCYQDSTIYSSSATGTTIIDTNVAVVPFCWVRSYANLSTNILNVGYQGLQTDLANGIVPLSYFSGKTNDYGVNVYVTGRNKDSGSRVTTDSDCGFNGTPKIYLMDTVTNNVWYKATVNSIINGANYGPGYSSGGTEAVALSYNNNSQPAIGYLGFNDSKTCLGSNACAIISYNGALPFIQDTNGVQYATNGIITGVKAPSVPDFSPIITGKYSFWCYEHIMTLAASGNARIFYDFMATNGVDSDIKNTVPVTALRLSQMHATRNGDGGVITP
jgi:hypothetical protein